MKDDYPLQGPTVEMKIVLEKDVAESLKKMSEYKKIGEAEMINTAVKRFIATHSDYFPKRK
jgi:hypothetical protein